MFKPLDFMELVQTLVLVLFFPATLLAPGLLSGPSDAQATDRLDTTSADINGVGNGRAPFVPLNFATAPRLYGGEFLYWGHDPTAECLYASDSVCEFMSVVSVDDFVYIINGISVH